MQNTRASSRQKWLNGYRIGTSIALALILAGIVVLVFRSTQSVTYTTTQATKVERAAAFLQDVGFNDPVYLGVAQAIEGEYPTFRATAIGGQPVKLWIRTTPYGGWEIQPEGMSKTVASADAFARLAEDAVFKWEHMPAGIKPRTDGAFGEYESRKYQYNLLAKYDPDKSYWQTRPNETADWPRK